MDMESGNLTHLGADLIVQILMLYSTSPEARLLTKSMLTDDPFNIDVRLDDDSVNRNVEILNVYLKEIGLRLVFRKKKKQIITPVLISPISYDSSRALKDPIIYYDKRIPYEVVEKEIKRKIESDKLISPITIEPIIYYDK